MIITISARDVLRVTRRDYDKHTASLACDCMFVIFLRPFLRWFSNLLILC